MAFFSSSAVLREFSPPGEVVPPIRFASKSTLGRKLLSAASRIRVTSFVCVDAKRTAFLQAGIATDSYSGSGVS